MSRKPEARYVARINAVVDKLNRAKKDLVHHQSMFTPYSNGTPDQFYEGRNWDCYVEYKWLPKARAVLLRELCTPLQWRWLQRRESNGFNALVVVGAPEGGNVYTPKDGSLTYFMDLTPAQVWQAIRTHRNGRT